MLKTKNEVIEFITELNEIATSHDKLIFGCVRTALRSHSVESFLQSLHPILLDDGQFICEMTVNMESALKRIAENLECSSC